MDSAHRLFKKSNRPNHQHRAGYSLVQMDVLRKRSVQSMTEFVRVFFRNGAIMKEMKLWNLKRIVFAFAVFAIVSLSRIGCAQQLYSFETPDNPSTPSVDESLEGFQLCTFTNPPLNVGVSTEAASVGTHSLKIEKNSGYAWDAVVTINASDTVRYPIWNAVAHNLAGYSLDFDVITNAESFSHVTFPSGGYMLLDVAVNSVSPNFPTQFNISP